MIERQFDLFDGVEREAADDGLLNEPGDDVRPEDIRPETPTVQADDIIGDQPELFDLKPSWREHWRGMPEFEQEDLTPWQSIVVHFASLEDRRKFARLVEQTVTSNTRSLWYPAAEIGHFADRRFRTASPVNPQYPVYVISKGRWESRQTARALDRCGVPYRVVIEPQERDQYAAVIDPARLLILPFSNLGQGSIPARNWVWEHSISEGAPWHWILDDNIQGFFRLYRNLKTPVTTGATFRAIEVFVERYENVAQAGMNYFMFASRKTVMPAYYLNTRVYSCILIRNDLPYRWRGRYNEDTDLSIRMLKDGWCTILFNAFLAFKSTTMSMSGGNTDELYKDDGRLKMAESLQQQHPDIVQVTTRWGRPQHYVDYRQFQRNRLCVRPGVALPDGPDEFGMYLEVDNEDQ